MPALAANKILVLGDSLSAAYGLAIDQGWVTHLEGRLRQHASDYSLVNASISGETTAGGRARLTSLIKQHQPSIVILELGANDGLRGLPVSEMKRNLSAMIVACQQANARVLLVGMRMAPNYGPSYTQAFDRAFAELAKQHRTALVPFLFEGFADQRSFFQADQLHPTAAAQARMYDNVWRVLSPMLQKPQ